MNNVTTKHGFGNNQTLKTNVYKSQQRYLYNRYVKYLKTEKEKAIAMLEELFDVDIQTQNYIIERGYKEIGEEDLIRQLNHQLCVTAMLLRKCPPENGVYTLSMSTGEYE